jgi:hypothetical protein
MSFDELLAAMHARLGLQVKVSRNTNGRLLRTDRGVLQPGLEGATEARPDEEGNVTFRVAPRFHWFRLCPSLVTDAQEEQGGRLLRIQMGESAGFVVETLHPPD